MAAACAVLLMTAGLTWSVWRPADSTDDRRMAPVATSPKYAPLPEPDAAKPVADPAPLAVPAAATAPAGPMPPPAQALADPCAPRGLANSEALAAAAPPSEPKPPRRAPDRQMKTAAAPAPDPGCGADLESIARNPAEPATAETGNAAATAAGRNPQADRGPVRAPAAAKPAVPAMHPSAVAPVR
jgi:hypothetical protein